MLEFARPRLHFAPKKGWINDPNGLVWDGRRYHLFAQHNPDAAVWGPMHWLHAVSEDLLHWEELGVALAPDALGTMFSGSAAMLGDGRMALMYTAHGAHEQQCVAFSTDGIRFEKYPGNPVIPNGALPDFRDPKLFWNPVRQCWGAAVAAGDRIAFYCSEDLVRWTRTGAFTAERARLGDRFECPDLFFLPEPGGGTAAVLTASMICGAGEKGCRMQAFLGRFDGDAFVESPAAGEPMRLDVGYDCYAGVTFAGVAPPTLMHWMTSASHPLPLAGYCGCMTLPRRLRLARTEAGPRLAQECALPELRWTALDSPARLPEGAFALRLRAEDGFELALRDARGEEALRVWLEDGFLCTERAKSARFAPDAAYNDDARRTTRARRAQDGPLELTAVVDSYCVEIFADGGLYAHGLLSFAEGGLRSAGWRGAAAMCGALG